VDHNNTDIPGWNWIWFIAIASCPIHAYQLKSGKLAEVLGA
jgi:hypothetical protein